MFKYNNTHIFTGYLKQLLASTNIPTCKIYTKEFAKHLARYGKEDPRVIESFDTINQNRISTRVNYLRDNEIYSYFWSNSSDAAENKKAVWKRTSLTIYDSDKNIPGLTKTLYSPGRSYDAKTHEYLGDYLRFLRDYYDINLMPLYNCFNDRICTNLKYTHELSVPNPSYNSDAPEDEINNPTTLKYTRVFNSQDSKYKIYAIPVKLFANYTVAIDCDQGIEMFCGLANTKLDTYDKAKELVAKTYKKVSKTLFRQPFLYDKLDVKYWNFDTDIEEDTEGIRNYINSKKVTRWDIINREQDLKLFLKIPTSCSSSIVILEGDYRNFNDYRFAPKKLLADCNRDNALSIFDFGKFSYYPHRVVKQADDESTNSNLFDAWKFEQNYRVTNFSKNSESYTNSGNFIPTGKLQLLAMNTGDSYPFSDRLVEYLSGSAILPIDEISDNIRRTQEVMRQNQHRFKIDGLWENKMQKIIYDYMSKAGPVELVAVCTDKNHRAYGTEIRPDDFNGDFEYVLLDRRNGYHRRLGQNSRSMSFDVLGYVDRDAEKWYASYKHNKDNSVNMIDNIHSVDVYNGLYDI